MLVGAFDSHFYTLADLCIIIFSLTPVKVFRKQLTMFHIPAQSSSDRWPVLSDRLRFGLQLL